MLRQFSHVGIAVHDIDAAVKHWTQTLGLVVVESFEVPEEGVRSVMLAAPDDGGSARIELVQPLDPANLDFAIGRRLSTHGEGVFHLAFEVEAQEAQHAASASGLELIPLAATDPRHKWRSVLHPKSANGVLIEVLDRQSDPTT